MTLSRTALLLVGMLCCNELPVSLMAQSESTFPCPPVQPESGKMPAPVPDTAGRVFLPPSTPDDSPPVQLPPPNANSTLQQTPVLKAPPVSVEVPGSELPRSSGVEEDLRRRELQRKARYLKLQMELRSAIEKQRRRREMEAERLRTLERQLAELNQSKPEVKSAELKPEPPGTKQDVIQPQPENPANSNGELQWKNADSEMSESPQEMTKPMQSQQPQAQQPESANPSTESALKPTPETEAATPEQLSVGAMDPKEEETDPPKSIFADAMDATTVIDGPVDRIGLADNLYALGELTIALEMYEQVDAKKVKPEEAYWVMFQRACCHRRLGQLEEAQKVYRRLAGQEPAGWLAKTARWWLDQMDTRAAIKASLETQTAAVESMKTTLKPVPDDSQLK